MPVQVMLEPVRSYVSGTISGTSPCRQSSMRPRNSHGPSVRVVFAREVVLEITHQVLEHVHMLAPRAQHAEALHEHGPILGGQFVPVPLARIGDEATPAGRWAISV